ncbi:hypothetical protein I5677_12090 [Mobilitalea sibirica]|uniref:Uncharacterized protein n=1 Tax=Mobilitalea sibirica TaxID=1462919 RepID=A0A8J7L320_9FIRM|nr:hypothetical protein [Mobilitalea sibirica]MBH1941633.1 hypothetical protein [Mobilitalea sibirica]
MDFLTFIDKAIQKEDDEKLYQMWLARYILMTKESFITFEAFKDMVTGKNIDMRSTAEILSEIDEVEALFERR